MQHARLQGIELASFDLTRGREVVVAMVDVLGTEYDVPDGHLPLGKMSARGTGVEYGAQVEIVNHGDGA